MRIAALLVLMTAACDMASSVQAAATFPATTPVSGACIEAGLRATGGVVGGAGTSFFVDLPEGRFQVGLALDPPATLVVAQRSIGGVASADTVSAIRSGRARILAAVSASCGPFDPAVRETCVRAECE
jgi:hypothetical protein